VLLSFRRWPAQSIIAVRAGVTGNTGNLEVDPVGWESAESWSGQVPVG
jgi:hypothetical protein